MAWHGVEEYFTVFGMLLISSFGAPIPEEVPIVYAGVRVGLAYNNPDSLLYWGIMLPTTIIGVVICDGILYLIGRRYGHQLLKSNLVTKWILSPAKRDRIIKNFQEYGIQILLFARLMPGFRMPIFMMSGVMHVPFRKFLLADGIYAIPGVSILFTLGYWLGESFEKWLKHFKENPWYIVISLSIAIGGFSLYVFLRNRVTTGDPKDIPVIGEQLATTFHVHDHPSFAANDPRNPLDNHNPSPPDHSTPVPKLSS